MRVLCDDQRSPDWFEARRGKITASEARKALAGKGTKGRRMYVEQLVDDLEGIPNFDDEEVKPWFTDGRYYESWARGWYSFKFDVDVQETGFVVHDEYSWIGCSPDGLLPSPGMLEIKYRTWLRTFDRHAQTGFVTDVFPQIQTQLFVCDKKWCDYVNYWRSIDHDVEKGHVQRVYRDQSYIYNTLLPAFIGLWNEVTELLDRRELDRARRAS